MLIVNKLPHFVYLNNEKFEINTDYRKMVLFEIKMQDNKLTKEERILVGLRLLYPAFFKVKSLEELPPLLFKEACDKLIWYYKCGREYEEKGKGKGNGKQIYNYDYDDEYIYSAFWECYKIDLEQTKMHWWKFRALMKGLNSECGFVKIKGYRAYTGDDKQLKELRQFYAIPMSNEERERIKQLEQMLK